MYDADGAWDTVPFCFFDERSQQELRSLACGEKGRCWKQTTQSHRYPEPRRAEDDVYRESSDVVNEREMETDKKIYIYIYNTYIRLYTCTLYKLSFAAATVMVLYSSSPSIANWYSLDAYSSNALLTRNGDASPFEASVPR